MEMVLTTINKFKIKCVESVSRVIQFDSDLLPRSSVYSAGQAAFYEALVVCVEF